MRLPALEGEHAGKVLRVGLIGCGRLAERAYVAALELAEGVELTAVADPERGRCATVAPGVAAFATAEELIESGTAEALVVATPAETHVAVAHAAAMCDLPTLVEKPPAPDTDGARALERLDLAPWLGFNRRFEPAIAALARKVPDGEPLDLTLTLSARRGAWDPHAAHDDILLDLGPHLIDLARWLSGAEIERIRARLDGESAELEVDLGSRGHATISCAGDRPWRERFEVRDVRGRTLAAYAAGGLRAHAARLRRGTRPHPLVVSLARQLEAFAAATDSRAVTELATAADGVATMRAIDAARASAGAGGAWVTLDLVGAPC
jgi:myo-inositol 2-dehydrogenase / D-chiro-inositol 1-dehydrogenase